MSCIFFIIFVMLLHFENSFKIIPPFTSPLTKIHLVVEKPLYSAGNFYMNSGIYKIHWPEYGYFYYGQSVNLIARKHSHFSCLKRGKHPNVTIQRLYDKYGLPEFDVIEYCDIELLDTKEQYWIDSGIKNRSCCNMSPTASSHRGIKRSSETKERIRQAKIGTIMSDEYKEKKRVEMLKRYENGWRPKTLKGKKNPFYKKKHDLITKMIMSQKKIGIYDLDKNPRAVMVVNIETGIFYGSIKEAAIAYNINESKSRKRLYNYRGIKNDTSIVLA